MSRGEITTQDIKRYRRIWQEEFGEKIGADEARLQIMKLDELYQLLYTRKDSRQSQT